MLEYVTTHDDPNGVFSRWVLDGAERANTDNGRLHARVTQDAGNTTVSLYRDAARTELVADGNVTGDSGRVTLEVRNASGLAGTVDVRAAAPFDATIDVFYADDQDVVSLQKDVAGLLVDGAFAGRPGFAEPLALAKRVLDGLLDARLQPGWRADELSALADACARYALFFIYDHLSTNLDGPASARALHWRREARLALPAIRLPISGVFHQPFQPRVLRA